MTQMLIILDRGAQLQTQMREMDFPFQDITTGNPRLLWHP